MGTFVDHLEVHNLMDSSKAHLGDARHRAIFHSEEGIELALRLLHFSRCNVRDVCRRHVEEDLGFVPKASQYLDRPDGHLGITASIQARKSAQKHGGSASEYMEVHNFIDSWPTFMLHHTFGCFLVEEAFGVVITNSAGIEVCCRDLAEEHLMAHYGRLPSVQDALADVRLEAWMTGAKKAKYVLVD